MLKKEINLKVSLIMPSNVINLSTELAARQGYCALTLKQELTIKLRNNYSEKARLQRAVEFHMISYKQRVKEFKEIAERIELQEEKLLGRNTV